MQQSQVRSYQYQCTYTIWITSLKEFSRYWAEKKNIWQTNEQTDDERTNRLNDRQPKSPFQSRAINTRLRQCKIGCPSCFLVLNKLSHSNGNHACTVFWVQAFSGSPNAYFYRNLKNGGGGGVCTPWPISGSAHALITKYIKRHELYGVHTLSSNYGLTNGQTDGCRTDHYITKSCPSRNKKTHIFKKLTSIFFHATGCLTFQKEFSFKQHVTLRANIALHE